MKITCPECDAVMRSDKEWPAGNPVRCPKCGCSFSLGDDDPDDYDPRPRRRKKKKSSAALVIVPIVLGCLLLIGAVSAVSFVAFKYLHDDGKDVIGSNYKVVSNKGGTCPGMPGGGGQPQAVGPGPALGKEAPDIEGEDSDGKKFKLSDYGGKVVVLDFWAGW